MKLNKAVVFDCFGTVFDARTLTTEDIQAYNDHVRKADFTPYQFPDNWYKLLAHPDSAKGIKDIQDQGVSCIALSNGSVDLIQHLAESNGIKFDYIIDLAKHKVYKPNLDAYRAVAKDTPFAAADCLMVTANPTFGDIEGSTAVGMKAYTIRTPDSPLDTIIALAEMLSTVLSVLQILNVLVPKLEE